MAKSRNFSRRRMRRMRGGDAALQAALDSAIAKLASANEALAIARRANTKSPAAETDIALKNAQKDVINAQADVDAAQAALASAKPTGTSQRPGSTGSITASPGMSIQNPIPPTTMPTRSPTTMPTRSPTTIPVPMFPVQPAVIVPTVITTQITALGPNPTPNQLSGANLVFMFDKPLVPTAAQLASIPPPFNTWGLSFANPIPSVLKYNILIYLIGERSLGLVIGSSKSPNISVSYLTFMSAILLLRSGIPPNMPFTGMNLEFSSSYSDGSVSNIIWPMTPSTQSGGGFIPGVNISSKIQGDLTKLNEKVQQHLPIVEATLSMKGGRRHRR